MPIYVLYCTLFNIYPIIYCIISFFFIQLSPLRICFMKLLQSELCSQFKLFVCSGFTKNMYSSVPVTVVRVTTFTKSYFATILRFMLRRLYMLKSDLIHVKRAFEYRYIESALYKFITITILCGGYGLARAFMRAYLTYWRRNRREFLYSSVDNSTLFHVCTQVADRHASCSEGFSSESGSSNFGQSPSPSSATGVAGIQIMRHSLQNLEFLPDIVEVIMQSFKGIL